MSGFNLTGLAEVEELNYKTSKKEFLLLATFEAPTYVVPEDQRPPLDLAAVLDVSGSMSGEKIALMKKTVGYMIDQLRPSDQMSLISFASQAKLERGLMKMDEHGKRIMKDAVENLHTRDSTNLCGGLKIGVDELRSGRRGNSVSSCLMFTDGLTNVGPSTTEGIMDVLERKAELSSYSEEDNIDQQLQTMSYQTSSIHPPLTRRSSIGYTIANVCLLGTPALYYYLKGDTTSPASSNNNNNNNRGRSLSTSSFFSSKKAEKSGMPCSLNNFGFGGDHDSSLLRTLAEKADGLYYYVESPEKIASSFANCLGGLVSVVAQNIKMEFTPLNGTKIVRFLNKFAVSSSSSNSKVLDIGDIQSEEKRNIVSIVEIPALSQPSSLPLPIMRITATYLNAITKTNETKTIEIVLKRPETTHGKLVCNPIVSVEFNRLMAAAAMEEAMKAAKDGTNLDDARNILQKSIESIKSSPSASDKFCVSLVEDLEKCKGKLRSREEFNNYGAKYMETNISAQFQERCTSMDSFGGQERFRTASRFTMQKKF